VAAIVALLPLSVCFAIENLSFRPLPDAGFNPGLEDFIKTRPENFEAARHDLNRDGIDEIILRPLKCSQSRAICDYYIFADRRRDAILLSKIRARILLLGETYTHSVRNLLVYDDLENDYAHDIYAWDSLKKSYYAEDKGEESQ
jgi:hypothetical protein